MAKLLCTSAAVLPAPEGKTSTSVLVQYAFSSVSEGLSAVLRFEEKTSARVDPYNRAQSTLVLKYVPGKTYDPLEAPLAVDLANFE